MNPTIQLKQSMVCPKEHLTNFTLLSFVTVFRIVTKDNEKRLYLSSIRQVGYDVDR